MKVLTAEQRSDAWRAARAGMLTGTCAADILAVRKRGSGDLQCRMDLRRRLVCERITGVPVDDVTPSKAMQHGTEKEPTAFAAYEAATRQLVKRVGFVAHDELPAGCSPDGYVGDFLGLVELKCPKSTTHLEYLTAGGVPDEYLPQITHNLWVTGAHWCDFVSFDDRFPQHELRLFRVRVARSDVDLAAYELAVRLFLDEVEREFSAVVGRLKKAAA